MAELKRPLIILGSVRSGTTLLGSLLRQHPDVAYWEEPKHIWRHRHAYRKHDVLTAADATPPVRNFVRNQFAQFLAQSGRKRFVEKTPSNCVRVPFIREIFPDVQFIHLIRDGRAAVVSAMIQWQNDFMVPNDNVDMDDTTNTSYAFDSAKRNSLTGKLKDAFFTTRKFFREKHLFTGGIWFFLEAPAYLPAFLRVFGRKLTTNRSFLWGTRFPGIQDVHRTCSLIETCALQWMYSVQCVLINTQDMSTEQYLELRYEELTTHPVETVQKILSFADLPHAEQVLTHAENKIRPDSQNNWREAVSESDLLRLEGWLEPLLTQLGYD